MKRAKNVFKIIAILPVLLLLFSCTLNNDQESSAILIVVKITGFTDAGSDADFLESDVTETGIGLGPPWVVAADAITATLEAKLKEPETLGPGTSYQSSIIIDEYEVTYTYVDSDVSLSRSAPLDFSGRLSTVIPVDSSANISFVLVSKIAKGEAPLSELRNGGFLQVIATITFHGEDLTGKEVQATGYLTIYFHNYVETN